MLLRMFSLFDTKAQAFAAPFSSPRREMAMRMMVELLNQGGTQIAAFPEDFILFELGEFDDATGFVKAVPPESLGVVSQFRKVNGHG